MIYLASPYSDPDPAVMEQRFEAAAKFCAARMREGLVIYSPIVHCHPIAVRHELPRDWAFWEKFDREMIKRADSLWVLTLPGYDRSKGVNAEIELARLLGVPVSYHVPEPAQQAR